eukprot:1195543-Prorocentrum_minimum.AAC.1
MHPPPALTVNSVRLYRETPPTSTVNVACLYRQRCPPLPSTSPASTVNVARLYRQDEIYRARARRVVCELPHAERLGLLSLEDSRGLRHPDGLLL